MRKFIEILDEVKRKNPDLAEIEQCFIARDIEEKENDKEIDLWNAKFEAKETEPFRIVPAKIMMEKEPLPFPYLLDKLIPKCAITALTADSGAGKSLVALIIAKAIATGELLFGKFKTEKTKILIIDQEMDEDLLIGRFRSILGDPVDIDIMYEQFWTIDNKDCFEWLINKIKTNGYGLVIFDTLTMIHNAEENSSTEMRKVNELMLKIIAETHATVMYLHHHRKLMNGEKSSMASSRGSTEIIAKVASHLQIESKKTTDENDNTVLEIKLSQAKARRPDSITKIGFNIKYNDSTTSVDYLGDINDDKQATDEAGRKILEVFEKDNSWRNIESIINILTSKGVRLGEKNIRSALNILCSNGVMMRFKKAQMVEKMLITAKEAIGISGQSFYYSLY